MANSTRYAWLRSTPDCGRAASRSCRCQALPGWLSRGSASHRQLGLRALRGCRTSAALDLHAFAVAASHDLRLFANQALWGGPLAQHLARRGSLLPTHAWQKSTRIKPRALSNGAIHAGKQGANARDSNPRSGCPHRPANHWSHLSAWRPAGIRQPSLHRNSTVFTQYYFLGERCLRVRGVPRRHRKSRCDKRENSAQ